MWRVFSLDITIEQIELDSDTQQELERGYNRALYSAYFPDDNALHIFFRDRLTANGIAMESSVAVINDGTTVNDFRATAHEIGHLLGLAHTSESLSRLMYQGVNGAEITEEEISTVREKANFFDKF